MAEERISAIQNAMSRHKDLHPTTTKTEAITTQTAASSQSGFRWYRLGSAKYAHAMTPIAANAESNSGHENWRFPNILRPPTFRLPPPLPVFEFLMFDSIRLGEITPT